MIRFQHKLIDGFNVIMMLVLAGLLVFGIFDNRSSRKAAIENADKQRQDLRDRMTRIEDAVLNLEK